MTDVVVLRADTHGLTARDLAAEIRSRLPDADVAFAATPREERELVADAPVVVGTGIDTDLLDAAEELELFACAYAGYGHLPLAELDERGVVVTNAAGIHAPAIADQVLGYCLTFARNLHEGIRRRERGEWRHFQGYELTEATVTVVGLGAIGQAVVQRLDGFDCHTIGVRYTPEKGGPTDEVVGFEADAVHDAFARSDYVVIACPLTETTEGLVGAAELTTMEPHSVLVNVARGGVVDTDALTAEIQREGIRGAAIDVADPEPLPSDHALWDMGNVLITPHNAGHTPRHWERLADIVAENVETLRAGSRDFRNRVP
ncbi:D-2-hydroxyacid dehydrogenase [Halocalculus aciditolerans]|uniref:Phosphoglycerate dehydrogenase n=1 Tax=Halocalculus aciditolerans TaxID=1383812 RepID=A0A830FJF5_9EURY|nr:D-2-hydroxyacid dehydrogenase [Halocalculus aciditolerans]GGL52836.1 phosphoglycerate dehydrogenase [Halocalculus aciditolerans]